MAQGIQIFFPVSQVNKEQQQQKTQIRLIYDLFMIQKLTEFLNCTRPIFSRVNCRGPSLRAQSVC